SNLSLCASTDRRGSGRLESPNRRDSVDCAVERCDRLDSGRFGACDEVGLSEVDSVDLVDLKCTEEQRRIDDHDRWEPDHRANELCDLLPLDLVEGLEDEDDLGDDQVRYEQLVRCREECGRSPRL